MGPGNEWPHGGLAEAFPAFPLRKLADALEMLPLPSLVLADDGSAMAVNTAWTLLSGLTEEASWGEGWLGALEPLDRPTLRRRLEGAAATGEPGSGDFSLTGPDGGQWSRWWWRSGAPSQLVVCVAGLEQRVPADVGPSAAALLDVAINLINRLFSVGIRIASASSQVSGPAAEILQRAVDDLDGMINDLRSAVFASRCADGTAQEGM